MPRIMTFSRHYPSYHQKAGMPTYFIEKIWNSIAYRPEVYLEQFPIPYEQLGINFQNTEDKKHHTIRAGHRWKVGDWFRPVVWGNDVNPKSGRSGPYHSKQITFAPDIQVKKVWGFDISGHEGKFFIDGKTLTELNIFLTDIAWNDGLNGTDFKAWFKHPKPFEGQIICWNENIEY